jgi:hypothetical protein
MKRMWWKMVDEGDCEGEWGVCGVGDVSDVGGEDMSQMLQCHPYLLL